jgi:hypothetical protein
MNILLKLSKKAEKIIHIRIMDRYKEILIMELVLFI